MYYFFSRFRAQTSSLESALYHRRNLNLANTIVRAADVSEVGPGRAARPLVFLTSRVVAFVFSI